MRNIKVSIVLTRVTAGKDSFKSVTAAEEEGEGSELAEVPEGGYLLTGHIHEGDAKALSVLSGYVERKTGRRLKIGASDIRTFNKLSFQNSPPSGSEAEQGGEDVTFNFCDSAKSFELILNVFAELS